MYICFEHLPQIPPLKKTVICHLSSMAQWGQAPLRPKYGQSLGAEGTGSSAPGTFAPPCVLWLPSHHHDATRLGVYRSLN